MNYLHTGVNGCGKTQDVVNMILDIYVKENDKLEKEGKPRFPIYCNIAGVNEEPYIPIPDCQPIPTGNIYFGKQDDPEEYPIPEGFFVPPVNSVFIIDEFQRFDYLDFDSKLNTDPRTNSIATSRHPGLRIHLITQRPGKLNTVVRGFIGVHYHYFRPLGMPWTLRYGWSEFISSPRSKTNKDEADVKRQKLKTKAIKYYKSSQSHNIKFRVPDKLIWSLVFLFSIIALSFYKYQDSSLKTMVDKNYGDETVQTQNNTPKQKDQGILDAAFAPTNDPTIDWQKRKVHLPEDTFNLAYDEQVRPAMVIQSGKSCKAWNSYGDRLMITDKLCHLMANDIGFMPKSRVEHKSPYDYRNDNDLDSSNESSDFSL